MQILHRVLQGDFTITKRHLGAVLLLAGCVLLVAALAAEIVNTETSDFGTVQQLVTLVGVVSVVMGITLLPLGDRPA